MVRVFFLQVVSGQYVEARAVGVCHEARKYKRLKQQLTCAACKKELPRQDHISDKREREREREHFTRKGKLVYVDCIAFGFTARNWQAYECVGACKRKLSKSKFTVGPNFVSFRERRTFKCKACA